MTLCNIITDLNYTDNRLSKIKQTSFVKQECSSLPCIKQTAYKILYFVFLLLTLCNKLLESANAFKMNKTKYNREAVTSYRDTSQLRH
jgi:hypothetical protein